MATINGQKLNTGSAAGDYPEEAKHTVSSYFARAHLDNAVRQGLSRRQLLQQARLSENLLQQPKARISPQQLAALFQAIWRQLDDENLGLSHQPLRLGVFSLLAERMILCETLGQAMTQAERYYRLLCPEIKIRQQRQGHQALITLDLQTPERDPQHLLMELLLLSWHRFPNWLVGAVIPLHEVRFRYPRPDHAEEYPLLFPGSIRFEQDCNALTWPGEVLDWPIRRSPEQLRDYLKQLPLPWFRKQQFSDSITDQISRLLENAPADQLCTADELAEQLHMSGRNLRRRLTAEGSSFQQLKEAIRRDRAVYYLSRDNISVAEVARQSGYTEPTAFMRAFKSWTGMTPSQYRRRLLASD